VAKRKSSRRARSRKPSASKAGPTANGREAAEEAPAGAAAAHSAEQPSSPGPAWRESIVRRTEARQAAIERRAKPPRAGRRRASPENKRPQAPWHPWPLSELLIFVGLIGVVVWWLRGAQGSAALIGASVAAVAIGTLEFVLREHLAGYRSHTVLLAAIPVIVFHSGVILVAVAFTTVPRWVNIPLLVVDVALFALLYKLLRLRYLDARRERRFAGG
jgi:Flp pilus assembly protein TadB